MAAPVYKDVSSGVTDAGGVWSLSGQIAIVAGTVDGDVVIVQLLQDGGSAGAVALTSVGSAFENLAGTASALTAIGSFAVGASGEAIQHLWIGRLADIANGTWLLGGTNSTSEDLYLRVYSFHNVSTGTTLATVIENATAGNVENTVGNGSLASATPVTTLGPDRLALNLVAVGDDNAISAFTGETGGDWLLATTYAESSGTDGAIALQTARPWAIGWRSDESAFSSSQVNGGTAGAGELGQQQAQSFLTSGAITATGVTFRTVVDGSPGDNLIVEIQTDNAGVPSGTVVGTGATVAASSLPNGAWSTVAINASLSATTTYWLVFRRSGARDTSNRIVVSGFGAGGYADGASFQRDNLTWTINSTVDLLFGILTSSTGTINGGTGSITDVDPWGVVGFALIGTTVEAPPQTLVLEHGFVDHGNPGVLMERLKDTWRRRRGRILVPDLWLPEGAVI